MGTHSLHDASGHFTLLLVDTIGRTIAYPYEINAVVVMAVIGGTKFYFIIKERSKTELRNGVAKLIYEVQNLSFSYGEHQYFRKCHFHCRAGRSQPGIGEWSENLHCSTADKEFAFSDWWGNLFFMVTENLEYET